MPALPLGVASAASGAVADYIVTGTLNPDATGNYSQNGTHNGEPAYDRDGDASYWIWNDGAGTWFLSINKDDGEHVWFKAGGITGEYAPAGVTGTATIAAVGAVVGQPTMRRWGGVPHMMPGPVLAGRSW